MSTGLLMVYTGDEEGRIAAVLGQVFRALGRGLKVCMIGWDSKAIIFRRLGPRDMFQGRLVIHELAEEANSQSQDGSKRVTPASANQFVERVLTSGRFDMVVLGEIGTLAGQETLNGADIIDLVLSRPKGLHVLLTAQHVPDALVAAADLVTETRELISRIG